MIFVVLIFLRVTMPVVVAIAAKKRGRNPTKYFVLSFLIDPFLV